MRKARSKAGPEFQRLSSGFRRSSRSRVTRSSKSKSAKCKRMRSVMTARVIDPDDLDIAIHDIRQMTLVAIGASESLVERSTAPAMGFGGMRGRGRAGRSCSGVNLPPVSRMVPGFRFEKLALTLYLRLWPWMLDFILG
jgi:hypothetical protein